MTSLIKKRLLIVSALLVSLQLTYAEPPSGIVSFSFGPENTPVWDVSGPYVFEHAMSGAGDLPLPLLFNMEMTQDARGRLQGAGETVVQVNDGTGGYAAVNYRVSGRISGGGGSDTVVNFSVKMNGNGVFSGVSGRFSGSVSYRFTIDPENLTLVGTVRGSTSIAGLGSSSIKEDVVVDLPEGVDGAWTLEMNVLPLKKLGGTAGIFISDHSSLNNTPDMPTDRLLDGKLSGSYSSASDLSKIKVSGFGQSAGNVLDVSVTGVNGGQQVTALKGTLLGQRVRF